MFRDDLGHTGQHGRLVLGLESLEGVFVRHDQVAVDGEHDALAPPARAEVLGEQGEFTDADLRGELLVYVVGGGLGQGHQQRIGVTAPAGEVEQADHLAGDRVADRRTRAGEGVQVLRVVLMAEHCCWLQPLQRRTDPVGADELLGIAEARSQVHAVEIAFELAVLCAPVENHTLLVGEDGTYRRVVQLLLQAFEDRPGAPGKGCVNVRVFDVGQFDAVGGDLPGPRAPPGRKDRPPHGVGGDALFTQELLAGYGELVRAPFLPSGVRQPCTSPGTSRCDVIVNTRLCDVAQTRRGAMT
nr:hypothetical protein [Allosalinactinospora lopnorensis]